MINYLCYYTYVQKQVRPFKDKYIFKISLTKIFAAFYSCNKKQYITSGKEITLSDNFYVFFSLKQF